MSLRKWIKGNFENPRGLFGRLAGHIMANRSSNRERIDWTISLLDIQPGDRILEIGFGSGVSIQKLSGKITGGRIIGIDHSETMVRQASRRNADAIRDSRVELIRGSADDLPSFEEPFEKIFMINAIQFMDEKETILQNMRNLLKPGGTLAITFQPRLKGASDQAASEIGQKLVQALLDAGYSGVRLETKAMKPVNCVCALGRV